MWLLADAPALPLGTAGKYVAAAYVVFVVVILVYVAIMATRAQRLEGGIPVAFDEQALGAAVEGHHPAPLAVGAIQIVAADDHRTG